MNDTTKNILIALVVSVVVVTAALLIFRPGGEKLAGGTSANISGFTNVTAIETDNGIQIGSGNTVAIAWEGFGTCSLTQNTPGSFAASTTQLFYCPATGVNSGDILQVTLPAGAGTPAAPGEGFHVVSAFATTTNIIGVILSNDTGAATTTFKQATTSVQWNNMR